MEDSKEKLLASSLRSYQCVDISAWENYRVLDSHFWIEEYRIFAPLKIGLLVLECVRQSTDYRTTSYFTRKVSYVHFWVKAATMTSDLTSTIPNDSTVVSGFTKVSG